VGRETLWESSTRNPCPCTCFESTSLMSFSLSSTSWERCCRYPEETSGSPWAMALFASPSPSLFPLIIVFCQRFSSQITLYEEGGRGCNKIKSRYHDYVHFITFVILVMKNTLRWKVFIKLYYLQWTVLLTNLSYLRWNCLLAKFLT
jgi:hypothetical protein